MPKAPELSVMMHFRLTRSDSRTLARIAKHHERTASEVIRRLIADEAKRLDGQAQPKET
jgi:hypothetical protein